MIYIMNIGKTIKIIREANGLSISKLASKANIAQSTLTYIENGTNSPTLSTLESICTALGITIIDLLTYNKELNPEQIEIITMVKKLNKKDYKKVKDLLKIFIEKK